MQDPTTNLTIPIPQSHNEFKLSIVYKSLDKVHPDPSNPNTHPKFQLKQLIASFKKFGFINPILVDENSIIIAGHGRYLAAKEQGMTELPVIQIPVLSPAEKKALRIADNKIARNAAWDMDQLRIELAEIKTLDIDFDLTITWPSSKKF